MRQTRQVQHVKVWRGRYGDPVPLLGPLPAIRAGRVLAYEFGLPARFVPWPGRALLQRTFLLLDLGVSINLPCWREMVTSAGDVVPGIDPGNSEPTTWYVDLVHVTDDEGDIVVRDLYIDVMVPTDGRHQRMLDLDEFGDAIADGTMPVQVAVDGLRRWQAFLDQFLHHDRDPRQGWTDFPPLAIRKLAALPGPLGPVVTAPD
jgi:hypothetical protein